MEAEPAVRWRRRKEARPGEILEAALDCFAERGFAATRLEDVAARAGVTKGTVYLYFPSKEELFKAVVRRLHRAGDRAAGGGGRANRAGGGPAAAARGDVRGAGASTRRFSASCPSW